MVSRVFAIWSETTSGAAALVETESNGPWCIGTWTWEHTVPLDQKHVAPWRRELMLNALTVWQAAGKPFNIAVHTGGGRHGAIIAEFFEAVALSYTRVVFCAGMHASTYGLSAERGYALDQALSLACDTLGYHIRNGKIELEA